MVMWWMQRLLSRHHQTHTHSRQHNKMSKTPILHEDHYPYKIILLGDNSLPKGNLSKHIELLEYHNFHEPKIKPFWYNDKDFFQYNHTKGHKTQNCIKLKHLIQDLIDQGEFNADKKIRE